MADINQQAVIEIEINGQKAKQELNNLTSYASALRDQIIQANKAGDDKWAKQLQKELNKTNNQIRAMQRNTVNINETLKNLSLATPKELQQTIKAINRELNSGHIKRGSAEWKGYTEALRQVKQELKNVEEELGEAGKSMTEKISDFTQRWWGFYDITSDVLDGISSYANQKVSDYASMEEAQAQVIKYTGMEREEVKKLNEEFKRLDTRTAREELNLLAGEAGKLNITARESVAEYVDAANQINVALGEDLGDEATKNMAKLAMMFGEDDRLGLRGSMLATASAINTIGQTSTSSEPYLADFLSEMGSVGVQAKLSQANLLGYASVLDQNKVEASVASTAFQQLTMKMFQEPAKFAKIAGQSVHDFTAMLKTDANKAMLSFLTGLSKFGDLTETAPVIKSLSLDGQKAAQTLTALSGNISKIVAEQEKANQAYNEATSVTKEYSVQNNTVQAQLEKAQKRAHDLSVELGERLYPIMANGLHIQSNLTKVLIALIDFATEHKTAILTVVGAYLTWQTALKVQQAYMIAVNTITAIGTTLRVQHAAATAMLSGNLTGCNKILTMFNARMVANATLQKACTAATYLWAAAKALLTGNLKKAAIAMKAFNTVLNLNPIGLAVIAVTALVTAFATLNSKVREARSAQAALNKAENEASEYVEEHKKRIKQLHDRIHNNTLKIDERREAILELQKILPDYVAEIDDEGRVINENTEALKKQNRELEKQATLKKIATIEEEIKNRELALETARKNVKNQMVGMPNIARSMDKAMDYQAIDDYKKAIGELRTELASLQEELKKYDGNDTGNEDDENDSGNGSGNGGGGGGLDDDAIKAELKRIEEAAEKRKLAERMKYETGVIDREEYNKELLQIDENMYQSQQQLYTQGSAEWVKLEQKRLDAVKGIKDEEKAWSLHQLQVEQAEEETTLKKGYLKGEHSEEEHAEKMLDIRVKYLRKRATLEREAGNEEEAAKLEQQAVQLLLDDQLKRQEKYMQDLNRLRDRYLTEGEGSRMNTELAILDELLRQKLIKEEEYQKLKKKIQEKGEEKQKKEETNEFISTPTDDISAPLVRLMEAFSALNQKIKDGEATWQDYAAVAVTSIQLVSGILSSVSQLMQANQDAEIAKVEKKYDAEIEAAGANTAKGKKLEEQKQKEVAKIKTKYSKKQMKIEIAQALAQTAMAAINAYSSAAAIPITGWIMAPIAAAAAVAAGMLQIAAIKKQHEAQQAGYYEGGFTGGTHYRRVAGEVHEGEFVANHLAVQNSQILPALRLIDQAQRNNTISSLTAADVSEALGYTPQSRGTATPARGGTDFVTDVAAWTAVTATMERTTDTLDSLQGLMSDGLDCRVILDGQQGLDRKQRQYDKMNSNAHR